MHLGLDVQKDSISVGVLEPGCESPVVDRIFHDEPSVRRLIEAFPDRSRLRVCYEAGPTGYGLQRLLASMGVSCQVIAPSLIPTAPGDRVKTDKSDCRRLARLHRAGELVAIRVPTVAEQAVRDLCRARADLVDDRDRARKRLLALLLRHSRVYRAGSYWTHKHEQWLAAQRFDEPALAATFGHYRSVVAARHAAIDAAESDLKVWLDREPFADCVHRLGAYRGVAHLGALTLASEVCDWRRFARATTFMGFTGLHSRSSRTKPGPSGAAAAASLVRVEAGSASGRLRRLLDERRDEVLAICARYGASDARVFGSVARGDDGPASDIDLLVVLDGRNPLGRVSGLGEELSRLLGVRVDVVTESLLRDGVARSARRDAVPL